MKRDCQYRFNIQFIARTETEVTVGEFLNALGRRKSTAIIAAVSEYLDDHPELLSDPGHIRVSTISADQLDARIRSIVEEKLSSLPATHQAASEPVVDSVQVSTEIADMLNDLELFSCF